MPGGHQVGVAPPLFRLETQSSRVLGCLGMSWGFRGELKCVKCGSKSHDWNCRVLR